MTSCNVKGWVPNSVILRVLTKLCQCHHVVLHINSICAKFQYPSAYLLKERQSEASPQSSLTKSEISTLFSLLKQFAN